MKPLAIVALRIVAVWLAIHAYLWLMRGGLMIASARNPGWRDNAIAFAVAALVWALLTPALIAVAERLRFERHRLRDAATLLVMIPLLSLAASALTTLLVPPLRMVSFARAVLERAVAPNASIAALAVIFAFAVAGGYEVAHRERRAAELDAQLMRERAGQLRARLTPHFLLSTLEGIASTIRADPMRADRRLVDLARLLQSYLQFDRAPSVTLEEELELATRYVSVHPGAVSLRISADDEALRARIPPLVVLPLLEALASRGVHSIQLRAVTRAALIVTLRARTSVLAREAETELRALTARLQRFGAELTLARHGAALVASLCLPVPFAGAHADEDPRRSR